MAPSEYGEFGRCEATAKTTDERCGQPATGEHGKCYFHGGGGSGASEDNDNAITHGATADPTGLYDKLEDDAQNWVDEHVQAYIAEAPDADQSDVERLQVIVVRMLMERRGLGRLLEEGLSRSKVVGQTDYGEPIRDEEEHYLNRVVNDHNQTIRMNLKDWGFLNDPESQQAESMRSIAEILSED